MQFHLFPTGYIFPLRLRPFALFAFAQQVKNADCRHSGRQNSRRDIGVIIKIRHGVFPRGA